MAVLLLIAALDLASVAEQNNQCTLHNITKNTTIAKVLLQVVKWMCKAVKNAILKRHGNH